jgi:hypothetical protein
MVTVAYLGGGHCAMARPLWLGAKIFEGAEDRWNRWKGGWVTRLAACEVRQVEGKGRSR